MPRRRAVRDPRPHGAGAELSLPPSSEPCASLERFVPQVLGRKYPQWEWEGLDAVFPGRATRLVASIRVVGAALLLGDQELTPLFAELRPAPSGDRVDGFDVRVGEPGGGLLGISGGPNAALRRERLLLAVTSDPDRVDWVFRVTSEELASAG